MKRFTWGKITFFSFLCVAVAQADIKMNGHAEAGLGWQKSSGGGGDINFMLDQVHLTTTATVSDKTKVVVDKAFALLPAGTATTPAAGGYNYTAAATYFNGLSAITIANGAFSINEAYIEHKCASFLTTKVGMVKTPFGMEGMWDTFDRASYFNSQGYFTAAATNGWNYDLAIAAKVAGDNIPGEFELSIMDGRVPSNTGRASTANPAFAARYNVKVDAGSLSITPVASVYAGGLPNGGPNDFGFSGGAMLDFGMFGLNAEFIQTGVAAAVNGPLAKTRSIWLEPTVDLGVAQFAAKLDLARTGGVNDTHLGAVISKKYDDHRVRLVWQYVNLGGKLGAKSNDIRLLWGAEF